MEFCQFLYRKSEDCLPVSIKQYPGENPRLVVMKRLEWSGLNLSVGKVPHFLKRKDVGIYLTTSFLNTGCVFPIFYKNENFAVTVTFIIGKNRRPRPVRPFLMKECEERWGIRYSRMFSNERLGTFFPFLQK
jgi:uncharacterized protein YlaI